MKGVVLAGGSGTRLDPLTRVTNKHLLPLFDRPMIFFALELMARAGITDVVLVTGESHAAAFRALLGDGSAFGLSHLDYALQRQPAGIADALRTARPFVDGHDLCVLLADNVFEFTVGPSVARFIEQPHGARLLLAEVEDPRQFGVATVVDGRVLAIHEKPTIPASRLAVAGCYLYDRTVFDAVERIRPSGRGELEITDVNCDYLARGSLAHDVIAGYWLDCGGSIRAYLDACVTVAEHGANKDRAR